MSGIGRDPGARPWYADGLRFGCTRCGNCCTGAPGTVRVDDAEIVGLAHLLGVSEARFREDYVRRLHGSQLSLRERGDGSCVFYTGSGCGVYDRRPRQCRTWPFWRSVVHSPERWNEEAEQCPGMNRGPLHGPELIQLTVRDDGTGGRH